MENNRFYQHKEEIEKVIQEHDGNFSDAVSDFGMRMNWCTPHISEEEAIQVGKEANEYRDYIRQGIGLE